MEIAKLVFGTPAAERDNDLLECFVESDAYTNVLNKGKNVVLGNRGTGKSAIFRRISDDLRKRGHLVLSLAPEEFSYEMMSSVLAKEGSGSWAKHGAYTAAWKHLIYIESFRLIAKNGGLKTGSAARVYEHTRDKLKGFEVNPIGRLISYLKRMEGVKVGSYEAGLKAKELDALYKLEEIKPIIECLDDVAKRRPIVILVDELDNGWDASEDAKCFVSGLFSAATSINAKHGQNLRVIISLRRELFENIPEIYEDAQKISDMIEKISWTEETLLELIGRRIAKCFPEALEMTSEQCWNAVFSEKLSYRTANSFNYFIDRTLFRPREVIQFANATADAARSQGLGLPIDYSSIAKAEGEYSKARLLDIASEYKHQFPGLSSL